MLFAKLAGSVAERVSKTLSYFGNIFGILVSTQVNQNNVIDDLLKVILQLREDARKRGDWATADRLREAVTNSGIGLEDTPVRDAVVPRVR